MGKWAARLAEKTSAPPSGATDRTDKRGVLAVLAVTPGGGEREMHEPLRELPGVAWTDDDIAQFLARRARLVRWGWSMAEAEAMAERLTVRDRSGDDRATCPECSHYRPGRCANHRRAGLWAAEVGRDLASLLQRCPGFESAPGGGA